MNIVHHRFLGPLLLVITLAATVTAFLPKPAGNPIRVTVFWSTDCPVALRYASRLHDFLRKAVENPSLEVTLHYPNDYETAEAIQKYGAEHKFPIPGSLDIDGSLARSFGLEVVPCIVVEDPSGEIVYSGPLDDSDDLALVKTEYANLAIEAVLVGTKPKTRLVKPMGCTISRRHSRPESTALTWTRDIHPIIQSKCAPCHGPSPGSAIRLDRYADAVRWKTMIGMVVRKGTMPPFGATDTQALGARKKLTEMEAERILDWLKGDRPLGEALKRTEKNLDTGTSGVRVMKWDFSLKGGGRRERFAHAVGTPYVASGWVHGFRLNWNDPSFIRWAVITRERAGKSTTLGVWTMGDPLTMELRKGVALDFKPGDMVTLEVNGYGNPFPLSKSVTLDLLPAKGHPEWQLRTLTLKSAKIELQPMQAKTVNLSTALQVPVTWLWIRPMTKNLKGEFTFRLGNAKPFHGAFHTTDWQPALPLPPGASARSISIQSMLANKPVNSGSHQGGAIDFVSDRLEVEVAYLQP